jgi:hypothetical protein
MMTGNDCAGGLWTTLARSGRVVCSTGYNLGTADRSSIGSSPLFSPRGAFSRRACGSAVTFLLTVLPPLFPEPRTSERGSTLAGSMANPHCATGPFLFA